MVGLSLGLAVALLVRTTMKIQEAPRDTRVSEDTVARFVRVTKELDRLRADQTRLEQAANMQATAEQIKEELTLESVSAGLIEVKGRGVTVMLADLGVAGSSTQTVQVRDVLMVINELKASGADAIAVNGVRVTDRLTLARPQGYKGPLTVNRKAVDGPLIISAVGDPTIMIAGLKMYGGILEQLMPWVLVSAVESQEISIPPAKNLPTYQYAKPKR